MLQEGFPQNGEKMMEKYWCFLSLLTLTSLNAVETRRLPTFSQMKNVYPGEARYGGQYPGNVLMNAIGAQNMTTPNDTCPLRISTTLNLVGGHVITELPKGADPDQYHFNTFKNKKSSFNMYFLFSREDLVKHLLRMYGLPLESWTPADFIGKKGIMVMNITGTTGSPCSALLWDGFTFFSAYGYMKHTNLSRIYFWQTPDESCQINVKNEGGGGGLCFPSSSTVELESGRKVAMKDVKIGQRVKTLSKQGKIKYTPVVTFLDKSVSHRGHYLKILTASGNQITLKAGHLIFRAKQDMTSLRLFSPEAVHAAKIRPGDLIYTQSYIMTSADVVVGVASGYDQGAYAPVTNEGTLFVDGGLVSCFADFEDHEMANYLMGPLRALYNVAPNSVGAHGHHIHWFLKSIIRPVGVRLLGKEKFYHEISETQDFWNVDGLSPSMLKAKLQS